MSICVHSAGGSPSWPGEWGGAGAAGTSFHPQHQPFASSTCQVGWFKFCFTEIFKVHPDGWQRTHPGATMREWAFSQELKKDFQKWISVCQYFQRGVKYYGLNDLLSLVSKTAECYAGPRTTFQIFRYKRLNATIERVFCGQRFEACYKWTRLAIGQSLQQLNVAITHF